NNKPRAGRSVDDFAKEMEYSLKSLMKIMIYAVFLVGFALNAHSAPFKVGLVFDIGGRGDKSFNDSAYNGLERAEKELGIDKEYIEPSEAADRENALRQLASGEAALIIAVGFQFTDDVSRVAKAFPNKRFACIDY